MMPRSLIRLLPLLIAGALVLSGCGSDQAGVAAPPAGTGAATDRTGNADGGLPDGGLPDDGVPTDLFPTDLGSSDYQEGRTVALDMSVRVANLLVDNKTGAGIDIEVWSSMPPYGKKLITVPYGEMSEFFPPEIGDPMGEGQVDVRSNYSLVYQPVGNTDDAKVLMNQNGTSSPGQKLTTVIYQSGPDGQGGTIQTFADDVGSQAAESGFPEISVPEPPSGTAMLYLAAGATQYLGADPGNSPGFVPAVDGACLEYFDIDTGAVHDSSDGSTSLLGGTSALGYPVEPGQQVAITPSNDSEPVDSSCAGDPVLAPFDPGLQAGDRAYGFVYGSSLDDLKILVAKLG